MGSVYSDLGLQDARLGGKFRVCCDLLSVTSSSSLWGGILGEVKTSVQRRTVPFRAEQERIGRVVGIRTLAAADMPRAAASAR